jgi:hypothetical protein
MKKGKEKVYKKENGTEKEREREREREEETLEPSPGWERCPRKKHLGLGFRETSKPKGLERDLKWTSLSNAPFN